MRWFDAAGILAGLIFVMTMALLMQGCAGSGPVRINFVPVDGGLIGGDSVRVSSIEVDPQVYGRGCVALEVDKNGGRLRLAVQQDGTSDWAGVRAAYATAPEIVGAVMQVLSGPFDIIKGVLGFPQKDLPEPSKAKGCAGLFIED